MRQKLPSLVASLAAFGAVVTAQADSIVTITFSTCYDPSLATDPWTLATNSSRTVPTSAPTTQITTVLPDGSTQIIYNTVSEVTASDGSVSTVTIPISTSTYSLSLPSLPSDAAIKQTTTVLPDGSTQVIYDRVFESTASDGSVSTITVPFSTSTYSPSQTSHGQSAPASMESSTKISQPALTNSLSLIDTTSAPSSPLVSTETIVSTAVVDETQALTETSLVTTTIDGTPTTLIVVTTDFVTLTAGQTTTFTSLVPQFTLSGFACSVDPCIAAMHALAPNAEVAYDDCAAFQGAYVTPSIETTTFTDSSTSVETSIGVETIQTTIISTSSLPYYPRRAIDKRDPAPDPTIPAYAAAYCTASSAYASACSCFGLTSGQFTLPTQTVSTTYTDWTTTTTQTTSTTTSATTIITYVEPEVIPAATPTGTFSIQIANAAAPEYEGRWAIIDSGNFIGMSTDANDAAAFQLSDEGHLQYSEQWAVQNPGVTLERFWFSPPDTIAQHNWPIFVCQIGNLIADTTYALTCDDNNGNHIIQLGGAYEDDNTRSRIWAGNYLDSADDFTAADIVAVFPSDSEPAPSTSIAPDCPAGSFAVEASGIYNGQWGYVNDGSFIAITPEIDAASCFSLDDDNYLMYNGLYAVQHNGATCEGFWFTTEALLNQGSPSSGPWPRFTCQMGDQTSDLSYEMSCVDHTNAVDSNDVIQVSPTEDYKVYACDSLNAGWTQIVMTAVYAVAPAAPVPTPSCPDGKFRIQASGGTYDGYWGLVNVISQLGLSNDSNQALCFSIDGTGALVQDGIVATQDTSHQCSGFVFNAGSSNTARFTCTLGTALSATSNKLSCVDSSSSTNSLIATDPDDIYKDLYLCNPSISQYEQVNMVAVFSSEVNGG